jgi:tetratricopeptide (TPR) repeat protein
MMKLKTYIFTAIMAVSMVGCLEKLPIDAIPADKAINTVEEADQFMIGIYSSFLSGSLYSGYLTLLPDLQTDFLYAVEGYTNVYGDIWRWDIHATNREITGVYGSLYNIIGQCNFLLDKIESIEIWNLEVEELDKLDQLRGEAYFARALCYSELIKLFCKTYEGDEDAKNELGVVLVTKYNGKEPIVRSSLYDSYQLVLSDLDNAARYLQLEKDYNPSTDGVLYSSPYFNEYVVYSLRSRVALYMKDYEDAILYSSKVIDSGYYSLSSASNIYTSGQTYYQYMWSHDLSTESIWQVGFTVNSYGSALGTIFFNYDFRSFKPDYVPAKWVLDLYVNGDNRYGAFFGEYQTGHTHGLTWPLLIKYWGNEEFLALNILQTSQPKVFRLAEQYLIRAEAYANLPKPDFNKASADISTLRESRFTSSGTISVNEKNAMDIIEEERVRELYMEGFRLMDLKRWHKGFERKPQSQTLENGNHLIIEKDNPLFVWPIPQHELESPGADIEPNESNK